MKTGRLLLLTAATLAAQSTPSDSSALKALALTTTGAFFALSVADLKASAQWYTEKLGLKTTMEVPKRDGAAVIVLEGDLGGTGLIVELIQRDDAQPLAKATGRNDARPLSQANAGIADPIRIHGIFKAGVIVDDFDKTLAALKARHVEIAYGPYPGRANQRANVIVKDNSGNLLQFFGKAID